MIEAPLKNIMGILDEWGNYLRERREEAVETPPRRRSSVEASFGWIVPEVTFQLEPSEVVEQPTTLLEVVKAVQLAKDESDRVIEELLSVTAPAAVKIPSAKRSPSTSRSSLMRRSSAPERVCPAVPLPSLE